MTQWRSPHRSRTWRSKGTVGSDDAHIPLKEGRSWNHPSARSADLGKTASSNAIARTALSADPARTPILALAIRSSPTARSVMKSAIVKPIPHRKLDGTLLFTAGELRAWIRDREAVLVAGRSESTASGRSGQLHAI